MSFLFCRLLFPFLGRGMSVKLLEDLSLSNADLHACKVPSFVGREMFNLLNTYSRGVNVPKRSNIEDLDKGSSFSLFSTSKVMCCAVAIFSFPLAEI